MNSFSEGSYICLQLDNAGKLNPSQTVNLNYMYQNSQNTPPSGVKLKYTLSANQYGTLLSGEENIESNKCYVKNKNIITFDENTNKGIKKQLEDAQSDTTAQNWAFGTSNTIEGRLSYTATGKDDKTQLEKILNKKDIKIYFVASKTCPTKQIMTCEIAPKKICDTGSQSIPCTCVGEICRNNAGEIIPQMSTPIITPTGSSDGYP